MTLRPDASRIPTSGPARSAGPLTIALVSTAADRGGTWRHIRDLAGGFLSLGHSVRVVTRRGTALEEAVREAGLAWQPMLNALRDPAIEIWHQHLHDTYEPAVAAMLLARGRRGVALLTEHLPRSNASDASLGASSEEQRSLAAFAGKTLLKRAQYRVADRVITVGNGAARFMASRYGLNPARIDVIENGILPLASVPIPQFTDGLHVVGIGSIIQQKGFDLLVEALQLCSASTKVTVIGEGAHLDGLRRSASRAGLDGRFEAIGRVDDPQAFVRAAHLVCVPSRWESSSYVALEAGALGRPVVCTAVDGVGEIVVNERTGLVVPANDPAALAAALDRCAASPDLLANLGAAAYRRVAEEFHVETMVRRTLELYDLALGQHQEPAPAADQASLPR